MIFLPKLPIGLTHVHGVTLMAMWLVTTWDAATSHSGAGGGYGRGASVEGGAGNA